MQLALLIDMTGEETMLSQLASGRVGMVWRVVVGTTSLGTFKIHLSDVSFAFDPLNVFVPTSDMQTPCRITSNC